MIRFYASVYTVVMRDLSNQIALLGTVALNEGGATTLARVGLGDGTAKALTQLLETPQCPLSARMRRKIERLRDRAHAEADTLTLDVAEALLKELHNDLLSEMSSPYFLMIPAEKRWLYEQRQPPFGQAVADRFPDASYDVAAAARCAALDESTAEVFHLMRVLEHGLRWLSNRVGVVMDSGIEFENWKNIIDMIEKQIRAMESQPKSPEKSETLQFYSQAASQFRYFKDAWRNHVSHARAQYDPRQAREVYNHVGPFMQDLAQVEL